MDPIIRATALEEFDRAIRLWQTAHEVARRAEDRYIEVAWLPPLRDESRRQRRAVLVSAVVTIGMTMFGLRPTAIPSLGLSIDGVKSIGLLGGAVVFTLYFWIEFLAFACRDFRAWSETVSVAYRELHTALDRERAQTTVTYQESKRLDLMLKDCDQRKERYRTSVLDSQQGRWWSLVGGGGVGWVEYGLPHAVALAAILLGSWGVALEIRRAWFAG